MDQNQNNGQQTVEQSQQPMYNQPMYQQPYNGGQKESNGTAGMVLGIISVVSVFIGFFAFGIILYTVALACGIVGIVLSAKDRKNPIARSKATAGLVLSIIGTSIAGIGVTCLACACAAIGCVAASL